MATTKQTVYHPFPPAGMAQDKARHLIDPSFAWSLINLRPNNGRLEETPRVCNDYALTTIFSQTASPVRLVKQMRSLSGSLKYLVVDQKTARFVDVTATGTQLGLPCILQTAQPNDTTVAAECIMYGFNVTDFAANGDNYEVNTLSTTTWQWRKNGGAWSAAQSVLSGAAITINGLTVAFQTLGPLVAGLTWKWTRSATHPYAGADATTSNLPQYQTAVYGNDLYIAGLERNVVRVRDDLITSVGYRRVYGKYVCIFKEHLVVGQYAPGVYDAAVGVKDSFNARSTPFTVGWSHLANPDQFFASTTNEADSYMVPDQSNADWAQLGITGLEVWNDVCYIFLADAIYAMVYVGLPTVMRTTQINGAIGSLFVRGLVKTPQGLYFVGRSNIYRLNGVTPEAIGDRIFENWRRQWVAPSSAWFQRTFAYYNPELEEVCWVYYCYTDGYLVCKMLCYNERTGVWYYRSLPSTQSAGWDVFSICQRYDSFGHNVYGGSSVSTMYKDATSFTSAPAKEEYNGTAYWTNPSVEVGWMANGDIFSLKEVDTVVLDAAASNLAAGLGEFKIEWYAKTAWLQDGNAKLAYPTSQSVLFNEPEALSSFPRTPYRWMTYKFSLYNNASVYTQLPYNGVFNGWQENLYFTGSQQ